MLPVPCWTEIVYGPVPSRRFGRSLGINLFPSRKVCNFDCVYCHFGRTGEKILRPRATGLPAPRAVATALAEALCRSKQADFITFSGNGESTLHPRFPEIVTRVVEVRNRVAPEMPLAILSNSSRVHHPETRRALAALDLRVMKLDAADQETFERMNRPHRGVKVDQVIEGLCCLRPVVIQSLFVEGVVENSSEGKVRCLIAALREISPAEVQVYTAVRWTAEGFVHAIRRQKLMRIAACMNTAGIAAHVY